MIELFFLVLISTDKLTLIDIIDIDIEFMIINKSNKKSYFDFHILKSRFKHDVDCLVKVFNFLMCLGIELLVWIVRKRYLFFVNVLWVQKSFEMLKDFGPLIFVIDEVF